MLFFICQSSLRQSIEFPLKPSDSNFKQEQWTIFHHKRYEIAELNSTWAVVKYVELIAFSNSFLLCFFKL